MNYEKIENNEETLEEKYSPNNPKYIYKMKNFDIVVSELLGEELNLLVIAHYLYRSNFNPNHPYFKVNLLMKNPLKSYETIPKAIEDEFDYEFVQSLKNK